MISRLALGSIEGLTIALLALGLVLVFKAQRFVNFAHAQLGAVSAMILGKLVLDQGVSWWMAFPPAVALGAGIGGLSEFLIIRRLRKQGRLKLLIATVGLSQVLLALTFFDALGPDTFKLSAEGFPVPINAQFQVGALTLRGQHIMILLLVPVLAVALALMFKYTTLGKAIRAAASNPSAAGLAGISVRRVGTITWALAGGLSAVSAILAAPSQSTFDLAALGPGLMLRALGAAAIAGFTSMRLAFGAGVVLGIIEAFALFVTRNEGSASLVMLIAILVGLLLRAGSFKRLAVRDLETELSPPPIAVPDGIAKKFIARRQRALLVSGGLFLGIVLPLLPPFRSEANQFTLALTLVFALVAASLTVLTGWSGQVSLGQFAFLGVGAFIAARMFSHGWPVPAAMIVCGLIGAALAVVIGLPALRLTGLSLAVTTLGFAVVAPAWLFRQEWFAPGGTRTIAPPRLAGFGELGSQRSVYYTCLAVLVIAFAALSMLRRSSPGRLLIAVRDNEDTTAAFGVSPTVVKLSAFALSGFVATAAGVLFLSAWRTVSVELMSAHQSQILLAMPVIGGMSSLPGAVIGAAFVYALPALTADFVKSVFPNTLQFQLFLAGWGLIMMQIQFPMGVAGLFRKRWQRFLNRVAAGSARAEPEAAEVHKGAPLEVEEVTVRFGGITALDHVSVNVRPGEIVGLIGANGAGKSTLLNVVSGVLAPESGTIRAFGNDLTHLGADHRYHFGIGRSFQGGQLFPDLTVRESIQVALAARQRVGFVSSLVGAPWVRFTERRTRRRAEELIDELGLTAWSNVQVGNLSTGTRRVCDLAAQMAAEPKILLLDEPTSGIAQREAEAFGPLIRKVASRLECSVLIVEHDMPLILGLADRIYCMEAGRVIAEGTPTEVRNDPQVIASYLGTGDQGRAGRVSAGPRAPAGRRTGRSR